MGHLAFAINGWVPFEVWPVFIPLLVPISGHKYLPCMGMSIAISMASMAIIIAKGLPLAVARSGNSYCQE